MDQIRIATRGSKLALWQAEHIKGLLQATYPDMKVGLVIIKTKGDKIQDVPLAQVGGKGLFVKEIEEALLDGRADIAVHSMKDVPTELPEELMLGIIPQREACEDCLVSMRFTGLDELPEKATVGTSSLRRQAQLLNMRPDLNIVALRGNLDTRLGKLERGDFDAIVVARAGLNRLNLSAPCMHTFAPDRFLPAVAQGALGIEFRADRSDLASVLAFMDDHPTRVCVLAERAFLFRLEGGCQVPIACHAVMHGSELRITGMVADVTGRECILRSTTGPVAQGEQMGRELADVILDAGGRRILQELYLS
ncbi:hydroxymethylbilane synthase [Desulfoplanes formicivorans]|uniref:Porphobilinogen deaminase n=1 Tax=Desulfoplanes formicivorans TaxID=1592317 RepID=A0A194AKE5_9BACT|nr:hydroxymethylbilane synthase [Desulfoplanes formicivorans]GAU09184.1 hydroxymethylbilane synthase [Desulfoplanes formicivorans]